MSRNFLKIFIFLLSSFFLLSNVLYADYVPKYIFYFIGGGLGSSQRQIAEYFYQNTAKDHKTKLRMNSLAVSGAVTTHSLNSFITDSAAAATALATGQKTNNGWISKLPGIRNATSILYAASMRGYKTALITNSRLTDPTPAAFYAHNSNKEDENKIASELLNSRIDFIAGGGYKHFMSYSSGYDTVRTDNRDIAAELNGKGYHTFIGKDSSDKFRSILPINESIKVFASFTKDHMPYEIDRINSDEIMKVPSLDEMTEMATRLLSLESKFFIVVDGGRIDHALKNHDISASIHEIISFDNALQKAYEFKKKHKYFTLIVVTGDHETGGLSLGSATNDNLDFETVTLSKASIGDMLSSSIENTITNDIKKTADFNSFLEENMGLIKLSKNEENIIDKSFSNMARGIGLEKESYNSVLNAVSDIINARVGVSWGSTGETATQIPLSAEGTFDDLFRGYMDNTDIVKIFANLLGLNM